MMLSCKKATLLMEKSSEGKLSGWQKVQLRFHNFMCKNCAWFFQQMEFVRKNAHHMEDHIEAGLSEEQKLEMHKLLSNEIDN